MGKLKLVDGNEGTSLITPIYESIGTMPGVKRLKMKGTAIVCDEAGINGRTYPTRLMSRECNNYNENYIKTFNALGELNHPPVDDEGNPKLLPVTEINLEKVSHIIEELKMVGNRMMIKFRVIEKHPCGAILKILADEGIPIGVSLRGLGSVYRDGGRNIVSDDYELITIDAVGRPSYGKDAMMQAVMEATSPSKKILTESVNGYYRPLVESAIAEFRNEVDMSVKAGTLMQTQYYSLNKLLNTIGK